MNNFSHLNINRRRTRVCNRRECILIRQNIHFSHLGVKPECFREQPIVEKRTEFSSPSVIIIEWILCSCLEFDTDDNAFLGLGFPPKEVLFFLLPCSFLLVSYHVKGVIKIGTVNYPIDIFSLQNPSNGSNVVFLIVCNPRLQTALKLYLLQSTGCQGKQLFEYSRRRPFNQKYISL
ncbi:hypothetical protein QQP08_018095 [Theobroma cacao]|nr:hypothetical protein QQP08_018095 [Theobroma cacao]